MKTTKTDLAIRSITAVIVVGLGGAAAIVSYAHALHVATTYGQHGWTATLTPLTIDGLVLVAGMVLLDAARRSDSAPVLAYVTLGIGIAATLAVNVLYGWEHGPIGAVVAGWPAVALVLSTELLMGMIRRAQRPAKDVPAVAVDTPVEVPLSTGHVEVSAPAAEVVQDAEEVTVPESERLSPEDARRVIEDGWTRSRSVRETAAAATRSASYVGAQFKKLEQERGPRPVAGQLHVVGS